ncbi:hypothetical protein KC332_g4358 [Hortaea werneckii]|nr:hypothetical protein KC358_g4087 [Hortaea werneckii]OTA28726.1 hypothetical protein BTJ68_09569 [Hortaea werneckii EXF-2000]KAI6847795.1 hypothetical protein KC350_g3275 [Hortaea werneckii]KAI6941195.1 hypothetical protein KC341_g3054 [Hortaea werneckii]KAI6946046.1 hypothetical protein KC348_g3394 [Hortaea werneckii]
MTDQAPTQQSKADKFMRGAGEVRDTNLWGPAKWVVQLVQYMVAIIMITIGEGFKAIVTGKKPQSRRRARSEEPKEE